MYIYIYRYRPYMHVRICDFLGIIQPAFIFFRPGPSGQNNCPARQVQVIQGIRRKKLGFSDIYVSEMGLGTQRHLEAVDLIVGGWQHWQDFSWSLLGCWICVFSCCGSLQERQAGDRYTSAEKQREIQNAGIWRYNMYQNSLVTFCKSSSSRSTRYLIGI